MEFNIITISLLSIAVINVLIGFVLLVRFEWFKGWLIGSIGLGALTVSLLCSVIILSFNSYASSSKTDSVATVSFKQIGTKHFKVELAQTQGNKHVFELKGDMWQVEANILSWNHFFESQGLKPYYQVNKITSSYLLLRDAERLPNSSIEVKGGIADRILNELAMNGSLPLLKSKIGTTGALPMADGALFSIRLNRAGLVTKPENQNAFNAIR